MATKRTQLSLERPSATLTAGADAWVGGQSTPATDPATRAPAKPPTKPTPQDAKREPIKRLTIDIPESLHREMKIRAATTGTPMVDEVRALLEAHYRH